MVTQDNVITIRGPMADRPDSSSFANTNVLYFATDAGDFGRDVDSSFILVANIDGPTGVKSWVPLSGCCASPTGIP